MSATFGPRVVAALSIVALAMAGCGTGQPTAAPTAVPATPTAAAGPATVNVTLQEWAIVPATMSAPAGAVMFKVTNKGPDDVHEFVVLKTDLDAGSLPTDANGSVSETGAGIVVVDEIEDIPVGQAQELGVTLAAGKYVLLCNIYDEAEKESHYQKGMRIGFDVPG